MALVARTVVAIGRNATCTRTARSPWRGTERLANRSRAHRTRAPLGTPIAFNERAVRRDWRQRQAMLSTGHPPFQGNDDTGRSINADGADTTMTSLGAPDDPGERDGDDDRWQQRRIPERGDGDEPRVVQPEPAEREPRGVPERQRRDQQQPAGGEVRFTGWTTRSCRGVTGRGRSTTWGW